jgi:hypothetical protein
VIWMVLLDLAMALAFPPLFAPERPLADAYVPCCATSSPCECPKDSPCKKDCCKDGCTCKSTACCAVTGCPGQACGVPVGVPMPAMPAMADVCLYEVRVKIGKHYCTTVMMPADNIPLAMLGCHVEKMPYCQHLQLRLEDTKDGCVKLHLHANRGQLGCGGYPAMTAYQGSKKVHPDTVANVLLGGDEAEPLCAEVLVKAVAANAMVPPVACMPCPPDARWCPPPMPYAMPMPQPAPAQVAMPAPMPVPAPSIYLPEPLPLPAPAPAAPVVERCVATVPAKACCAHVELVRCCHKSTLAVQCEGVSAKGVRMTIDKGECGSLTVAAGKKSVHVHGKKWKAFADKVEIQADGRVLLSGHVKLLSEKLGVCASVKADKMCVQVKDGAFEKIVER